MIFLEQFEILPIFQTPFVFTNVSFIFITLSLIFFFDRNLSISSNVPTNSSDNSRRSGPNDSNPESYFTVGFFSQILRLLDSYELHTSRQHYELKFRLKRFFETVRWNSHTIQQQRSFLDTFVKYKQTSDLLRDNELISNPQMYEALIARKNNLTNQINEFLRGGGGRPSASGLGGGYSLNSNISNSSNGNFFVKLFYFYIYFIFIFIFLNILYNFSLLEII